MNTGTTWETVSNNLDDTLQIAEKIGEKLHGGEVIELASDIGGGKTTFVRGLASGIKSLDQVASPTFTISRIYKSPSKNMEIHHFDFYRIKEQPGLMKEALSEAIGLPHVVTVIEWAEHVAEVLPEDRLKVSISSTGEHSRHFAFTAGPSHSHLKD